MDIKKKMIKEYSKILIIGASIIFSIFLYPLVAEIIRFQNIPFKGFSSMPISPFIKYGIWCAGIIPLIILNYLKDYLYSINASQDIDSALNKLKSSALITFALLEIPAICGFILFLLWGITLDFYLLIAISLILEFKNFPRFSYWEEIIKNRTNTYL